MIDLNIYAGELGQNFFALDIANSLGNIAYVWNNRFGAKTAGVCRYKMKDGHMTAFQIDVSRKYVGAFPEMLDSILLHEMIHAVLPFEEKHGKNFKRMAMEIMDIAKEKNYSPLDIRVRTPKTKQIARDYKFSYYCMACSAEYNRVRKPIDTHKYRCGLCRGELAKK